MSRHFQPKDRTDCEKLYGRIVTLDTGKKHWLEERQWMVLIEIPKVASKQIINSATGKPWDKVYCNRDMAQPLIDTLELLHVKGLLSELDTFDGCYSPRDVRGMKGITSFHSWGLAIDLNAADNALGCESKFSQAFVDTMEQMGWFWGGRFKWRCDPMHWSWVGEE
jgi:hypothetical protein